MADLLFPLPAVRADASRPAETDLRKWLGTFDPPEDLVSLKPLSPLSDWRMRGEDFGALAFQASTGKLLRLDGAQAVHDFAQQHSVTQFVPGRSVTNSLRAPVKLFFDITKLCNLKCRHCLSSSGQSVETLPAETIKSVLHQAYDLGVFQVKFGGGEPLLHPRFFELVNFANSRSMRVSTSTNGTVVTKRRAALIKATGVQVSVSIDGDKRMHDLIRGKSSYQRALRGIERLIAAGAKPSIRMTIFNHPEANNLHVVRDVVRLGQHYGIEVKLRRAKPAGRATDGDLPLAFPTEDYWALLDWLHDARKQGASVAIEDLMCLTGDGTDKIFPTTFDCAAGTRSIHVDVCGDVGPCVFLGPAYLSGNVFCTSLASAWYNGHGFHSARGYTTLANSECRDCARNSLCSGECRAIVFYAQTATGQPIDGGGMDPCCPKEQRVYEFTDTGDGKLQPVQVGYRERPDLAR